MCFAYGRMTLLSRRAQAYAKSDQDSAGSCDDLDGCIGRVRGSVVIFSADREAQVANWSRGSSASNSDNDGPRTRVSRHARDAAFPHGVRVRYKA